MDKEIPHSIRRRKKAKKWLLWAAATALFVAGAIWLLGLASKSVEEKELRFSTVESGPLQSMVSASGTVRPVYEEIITSPIDSRIVKVYVREGDSVTSGTPLLQLDLSTTRSEYEKMGNDYRVKQQQLRQLQLSNVTRLKQLEMQIKIKEMDVNRLTVEAANERHLDSLGSGTGERVRQAETALATARLELAQLHEQLNSERLTAAAAEEVQRLGLSNFRKDMELAGRTLDQGRIPAPYNGVVSYINNKIGSRVSPGERIAVISDLSSFTIAGLIPEGNSRQITAGANVEVRANGHTLNGHITNITASAEGGAVAFDVALDEPTAQGLRAGMHVDLYVSCGYKENVTRLSNGAFFKGPGEYRMFVLQGDGLLLIRSVTLGDSNRDYVEVMSGLVPGERVVISDMSRYESSKKLRIKQ